MLVNLSFRQRITYGLIAVLVLILMYMLQRVNYCNLVFGILDLELPGDSFQFIFNRTLRYIVNDLCVILLIFVLFQNRTLTQVAFALQIFGLLVILPIYFYFKLSLEGPSEISSPLLSFIHRIVVNPILMLLLIPAFYYQQKLAQNSDK
jgi:exosortase F-associated protein